MSGTNGNGANAERRAIFISGAGAGIGRKTAEQFAEHGWLVGLYDIDTAAVAAARAEIGPERALDGELDVTDPRSWTQALAAFTQASGGRLDVLFNNAGIIAPGRLDEVAPERHKQVLDVNVAGVVFGSQAAYPFLKATPGARVINMCSASAIYGQPDIAVYSASKFAVHGLTEALDLEWRKDGIKVMAIWPLWVKTALSDAAVAGESKTTSTLGVRLSTGDVAGAVWSAANHDGRIPKTHWHVGWQTTLLATASHIGPGAATRCVVGRLSGA
jgi:NAD(P)-dependent dehydrogenase (short-subunit alcohol dehydrogenase family)